MLVKSVVWEGHNQYMNYNAIACSIVSNYIKEVRILWCKKDINSNGFILFDLLRSSEYSYILSTTHDDRLLLKSLPQICNKYIVSDSCHWLRNQTAFSHICWNFFLHSLQIIMGNLFSFSFFKITMLLLNVL